VPRARRFVTTGRAPKRDRGGEDTKLRPAIQRETNRPGPAVLVAKTIPLGQHPPSGPPHSMQELRRLIERGPFFAPLR
jgi:hypothetical protein